MDGFAYDRGELLGAARRLDEAATAAWCPPGSCTAGSAVSTALGRLDAAWSAGHDLLAGDAAAARDGLLHVLSSTEAADESSSARLHALAKVLS